MSLRRDAVNAMADEIYRRVRLPAVPTVIDAPPSEPAQYPAVAILLDRFTTNWSQSWDIEVDVDGNPLVGTAITLDRGVTVAKLSDKRYLSKFGTLQGEGRIWVAARHAAKREELEDSIFQMFAQDGSAPGRLMLPLTRVKIGDFEIPWTWYVAATIEDASWKDEQVMAERLWSYINFKLDVDILVPRGEPIVQQFKFEIMNESLAIDPSGNVVPDVA